MKFFDRMQKADGLAQVGWNVALLTAGSLITAVSINGVLVPHAFLSGGFVGITLFIHYLFPVLGTSLVYALLNLPVYLLGYRKVGKSFFWYSVAGAVLFTVCLEFVRLPSLVDDRLAASLLAGILSGVGGGLMLKSKGSGGGADILSVYLMKSHSVRLGTTYLAMNVVIMALASLMFDLEMVMYTLVYVFVNSKVVNVVVGGLSQRKAVTIISPQWEEISQRILDKLRRGATVIPARGAYTGKEEQMVYTVVNLRELGRLKRLVAEVDPHAFMVVTETLEVMGYRIGNQPHW